MDYKEQLNEITPYLDAGAIYGSTQKLADDLRAFAGGRLRISPGDMLPLRDGCNKCDIPINSTVSDGCFLAGITVNSFDKIPHFAHPRDCFH